MSGVLVSLNRFFPIQLLAMLGAVCVISAEAGLPAARGQESAFYACRQLGRGVNLGNFLEPPRGADWGVKIEGKHLEAIKQAGFDSVRLPVRWADYASSEFPFSVEPAFFGRVDHLLDVAESHKLNVVLNIHHFDRLVEEPDAYLLKFESLWKQIATRYKKRGEFLYFELNNEPHGQLDASWNEALKVGLSAVRQSNPRRPVIVGPSNWNSIEALQRLQLPEDPNLIVTVHMYNPHRFTHQGASWVEPDVQAIKDQPWGTPSDVARVESELAVAAAWGKKHNRPIYLGEFGAYEAAPLQSRVRWTKCVVSTAERFGMSWSYWEFCAGFGVYDVQKESWRPELLEALGVK